MAMSKQARAKDAQGYIREGRCCGNCACFNRDTRRCELGEFVTVQTATCNQWRLKDA